MSEIILRDEKQRRTLLDLISSLDLKKPWRVTVVRYVKTRSNPQLALYWKWLHIIAIETGNEAEDLHDIFKRKFIEPDVIDMGGTSYARWTTGKMTAKEMSEYMERVMAFTVSNLGIMLPIPEEMHMREGWKS